MIPLSQLAQETKINHKNLPKYIRTLEEKDKIVIENSVYDKRKKLVKLNRIDKIDIWLIKDSIKLNGFTMKELKIAFPKIDDIEQIIKELHLESQIDLNKKKRKLEEERKRSHFNDGYYKPPIDPLREKIFKLHRYIWCLEKRELEIDAELKNGLTEQQKEILRKKREKIHELRKKWNVEIPEIVYEKFYYASYVNNLINFIL